MEGRDNPQRGGANNRIDQSETDHPLDARAATEHSHNSQVSERNVSSNPSRNSSRYFVDDELICEMCKMVKGGAWAVQCDGCDQHFHFNCVKFESEEVGEDDPWFCNKCREDQIEMYQQQEASRSQGQHAQNHQMEDLVEPTNVRQESASENVRQQEDTMKTHHPELFNQEKFIQSMARSYPRWKSTQENVNDNQQRNPIESQGEKNPQELPPVNEMSQIGSTESRVERNRDTVQRNQLTSPGNSNSKLNSVEYVESSTRKIPTSKGDTSNRVPTTKTASVISISASSSFKSASSKRTTASQVKARIEQKKIQAELELQAKLDDEKIALKLEALKLKESREKKFLEEKFKAMTEEDIDGISTDDESNVSHGSTRPKLPKCVNDTQVVLAWIEEQRKIQSRNAQITPNVSIDVSHSEIEKIIERRTMGSGSKENPLTNRNEHVNLTCFKPESQNQVIRHPNVSSKMVNSTLIRDIRSSTKQQGQQPIPIQQPDPVDQRIGNNGKQQFVPPNLRNVVYSNAQSGQSYQTNGSNQHVQPPGSSFDQNPSSSIYNPQMNTSTQGTANHQQPFSSSYNFLSVRQPLTTEQIAARHVVNKKLPLFYGNPGEWPNFIHKFVSTTKACGLDNVENLDRLSDCLRGNAEQIVRSMLSSPDCVPMIIETLEQKYGRAEVVIKAVLKELRAEPHIKGDQLETLCIYGYKVQNACHTIQRQKMEFYLHNPELIQEVVDKLPHQTKIDWARYSDKMPNVTLATLSEWLVSLSRSLNRITQPPEVSTYSEKGDRKKDQRQENFRGGTYLNAHGNDSKSANVSSDDSDGTNQDTKCGYCSKACKNLAECSKFKAISIEEKWKFLYGHKKICRGCLRLHKKKCTNATECGINGCSYKHHPILHDKERMVKSKQPNKSSGQTSGKSPLENEDISSQTNSSCNAHQGGQTILYKIIPVTLKNKGKTLLTHAYLDEGSGLTLIESELANELELKGVHQKLCLRWTSGTVRHEKNSMKVAMEISGVGEDHHAYRIKGVRTVESLDLPKQCIEKDELIKRYPYLERIPFQDFDAAPRILIGLDNVKLGLSRDYVEGGWTEPIAAKTLLGWVIHGQNGYSPDDNCQHMQHHILSINQCECQANRDDELHNQIENFFSLENFGIRALSTPVESKETQRANSIMQSTTIRKENRFETGLLWKYDNVKLPNNFTLAMKRLECQDRRMQSNPALLANINDQIRKFLVKKYARKLTPKEVNTNDARTWYLPVFHHLDPKKPEKVRLVWDAAAKFKGISLNSMLMVGPDNLVALIDILRRFREKCIAIGGDLEEMFHQVQVRKQDQNSQRFLWRNGQIDTTPDVYVMEVLTFGTSCSPSLSQYVKNKNASEFEEEYPDAAKAIKENHYVDDWLDCQHTVENTILLAQQVKHVHKQGGFNLRKFISNSKEVLYALGDEHNRSTKDLNVNATTLATQKVLGMWWDSETDCFTYSLKYTKLNEEVLLGLRAPTKREILKTLMSIYDPLGLIAFFLVYLKMLLQEVWKAKLAWDNQIPDDMNEKWSRWVKLLPMVEQIHIPRLYSNKISPGTAHSIELHTFVDASENAYCAVCFLRISDQEGVDCVLVGAKTKVASIKPLLTIPRLELLAAVLGTRLAKSIGESLTIKINKRYFWSDSRDVLCWIRSTSRKYRQFVAFRVGEILETTNETEWRWVPGRQNVADDGTKWSKNPNFDPKCRWFQGPDFLSKDESFWPQNLSPNETTEEEIHMHLVHTKLNPPSEINAENFSNWSKLVNAQALSTRFIEKLMAKTKGKSLVGHLTTLELRRAECTLYKLAQFDCFYDEISTLKKSQKKIGENSYVKKSSPLYKLSPYVDDAGIVRVRGRIDNIGGVKFETKRPIILPGQHKITKLIVNSYHRMYLHGNDETVLNELNKKFLIPRLRAVIKKVRSHCQVCKNKMAKPVIPEMGDLPLARLSPGCRAFTYTGVDYFGPMNVLVKRGTEKRWGVLFTCLTTRAIHIEIASSLTADSCILCVRNFTNIRGTPIEFWSDNGTNFKATDKELCAEFDKLDKEKVQTNFTRTYTSWHFNPPAAPHFGGSWERLIGIVKENLKMVMFTRTPKEELLRSYLLEVANIVNSRPLTHVPIDSSEAEVLTPNHFIIGSSNGNKAPGDFPFEEKSLTKSWRRSQELTNQFWKRWIKEYLPTLTCRTKWLPKTKPIEVGDVVLLVDEQNARNSYPKGIVLEVLPDKHGQVRQATIKLAEVIPNMHGKTEDAPVRYSIKTRPVAKLAVLDVTNKTNEIKPVVLDVANKVIHVKSTDATATECLNEEENVTDGTNDNVIDNAPVRSDNRKRLILRRSKRILDQKKK